MMPDLISLLQSAFSNQRFNILVVGNHGQLGSCLEKTLREESAKKDSHIGIVIGYDVPEIDISDKQSIESKLLGGLDHPNVKFHYVINCAAITDTTKIELDQSTRDLSYKVNVLGPKHLAEVCLASRSKLIHISTDYVFSELSKSNEEFPINEYGIHKLLGEKMVECTFGSRSQDFMILRTSWLYGGSSSSFPIKLLKNCIKASRLESKQVKVVDDCYGRPTSVQYLSKFIIVAIKHQAYGKIDAQASYAITRHEFADTVKSTVQSMSCFPKHIQDALKSVNLAPTSSLELLNDLKIRHPQQTKSILTEDMTMTKMKLDDIRTEIKDSLEDDPIGMFVNWLVWFNGKKMVEDELLKT